MTNENEFKKIIKESLSEIWVEKVVPRKNRLVEIVGVVLNPVVIAAVSLFVTYKINKAYDQPSNRKGERCLNESSLH